MPDARRLPRAQPARGFDWFGALQIDTTYEGRKCSRFAFRSSSAPVLGFNIDKNRAPPYVDRRVFLVLIFPRRAFPDRRRAFASPNAVGPAGRERVFRAKGNNFFVAKTHVMSLGATAMDMSSWKSSLHAYGSITCTTFVRSLGFLQHSNVWFLRFATATKPHVWHTWMRYASD